MTPVPLEGKRFGRLVVKRKGRFTGRYRFWECLCDCGAVKEINGASLRRGLTTSCGCARADHSAIRDKERTERVNLGLAILSCLAIPGVPLTLEDIAAFCDCSRQAIEHIERRALRKLRVRLNATTLAELRENLEANQEKGFVW